MQHRFDGMGVRGNIEMIALVNGEYFILDHRWDPGMHVAFLRDKLLADIAEG